MDHSGGKLEVDLSADAIDAVQVTVQRSREGSFLFFLSVAFGLFPSVALSAVGRNDVQMQELIS